MGACPSDLAGPECGGPPASTDELKAKQTKVRDAGVKARAAKKGLSAAEIKLSGVQAKLSVTQEELDGADLRIAQKGEKVATAKPERKPAALQEVEIEKAKKVRLEAEKAILNRVISSLQTKITTLKTESTAADTKLTTAKQDLSSAIQRTADEAAAKKAAEEAAAVESKRIEQENADKAAAAKKAAEEAAAVTRRPIPLPPSLPPSRATDLIPVRSPTPGQLRRAAMQVAAPSLDPANLSIESIDTYLTDKYSPNAAVDNVDVKSTIGKSPPFDRKFSGYIFGNYETLTTGDGGGRNDCLIHAVLGGVSSVFRKLTDAQKNESGDYFRRTVLPKTAVYAGKPVDIARLTGLGFLGNEDVGYIKDILKISILSFESAVSGGNAPGSADFFSTGVSDVYMIFNPDNAHYETVRVNGTFSYTIPIDTARDIKKVLMEGNIKASYARYTDRAGFESLTTEGFVLPAGMTDVNQLKKSINDQIEAAKGRLRSIAVPTPPPTSGPGNTQRKGKRKGGNEPVKYTKQTPETIRQDVESAVAKSPGVRTTATKLVLSGVSLPKGGRRRTFRKKKTLRQLEKKLDELKELISRSS